MKYTLITLIIIGLFGLTLESEARRNRKIEVQGALKIELNAVLKATDQLHGSIVKQDEQGVEASLKALVKHIDRAHKRSALAKSERPHLLKILNAARTQLEITQNSRGRTRQGSLKSAFEQLVQLAKVFKLDTYRIFFCPTDRSVWLQKGWKPFNPIHPQRYKNCGKLVRG